MILSFIKLDINNKEHLYYTYGLLKQRFKFPNTVVGKQVLPSYQEHVNNLKNRFIDYRLIYYKNFRVGIVALNKDYSLTHNYDFNSLRRNIKKITREHFEMSYSIISQYLNELSIDRCTIKINPKNERAFVSFVRMLEENQPSPLSIDSIQLNLKYAKD